MKIERTQQYSTFFRLGLAVALSVMFAQLDALAGTTPKKILSSKSTTALNTPEPQTAAEHNNRGVDLGLKGLWPEAIHEHETALDMAPNNKTMRANLSATCLSYGKALMEKRLYSEASLQFRKALYVDPANKPADSALDDCIRAITKENPSDLNYRKSLAEKAEAQKDYETAVVEYRKCMRIAGSGPARAALLPGAIAVLTKAIERTSDDPILLGDLKEAWQEVLQIAPHAPENHIGLGQAYEFSGEFDLAEDEFKKAVSLAQSDANMKETGETFLANLPTVKKNRSARDHINAGVDLHEQGLYDQAIDEYKAALSCGTTDKALMGEAWLNIGAAHQKKGSYDEAISAYKAALSFDPENSSAKKGITSAEQQKKERASKASNCISD